jgi:pSer/pThr/pTyr-binding forkhead associated (FHA) protein
MLVRLVVEKNGKRAKVVELRGPNACIGRARGNEVRIPSADVSRRHCVLREDDGLLKVEDLESVNGTYLNGDLLTGEAVVRPGDRLEVGPVQFVVEYDLTPDAVERLAAMDFEIVASGEVAAVDDEEAIDEEAPAKPKHKPRGKPAAEGEDTEDVEAVEDEDVLDVEPVVEDDYTPRADLDEVTWAPPQEGDLRDLLGRLDEGQESLLPKKRPGPRKPTQKKDDDWPADRRSGLEPPDPKGKGGKRRPKAEGA